MGTVRKKKRAPRVYEMKNSNGKTAVWKRSPWAASRSSSILQISFQSKSLFPLYVIHLPYYYAGKCMSVLSLWQIYVWALGEAGRTRENTLVC